MFARVQLSQRFREAGALLRAFSLHAACVAHQNLLHKPNRNRGYDASIGDVDRQYLGCPN
jgi:hypothetical protein